MQSKEIAATQQESHTDALARFRKDALQNKIQNQGYRRGSVVPQNYQAPLYSPKTITVRHPLRERSKSITLPNYQQGEKKNFPISRLNSFDPHLKKHRGSVVSMQSSLQSIEEGDDVEHEEHSSQIIKQPDAIGSKSKL